MTEGNDNYNLVEYDKSAIEAFQLEHQRLLRALYLSIDHENELHTELRRLKESLVAISLRFHLSVKLIAEDEKTIAFLRQEALDGKKEAMIAKKQAKEAMDVIQSLRYEIHTLKKLLNETTTRNSKSLSPERNQSSHTKITHSSNNSNKVLPNNNQISLGVIADKEVDEMFEKLYKSDNKLDSHATSFQIWKIKNFIYTSDTPHASENHDEQAVQMLSQQKAIELADEVLGELPSQRLTRSSLSRSRPKRNIHSSIGTKTNSILETDLEFPSISTTQSKPLSPIGKHSSQQMKEQIEIYKASNKHFSGINKVGNWGNDNKIIEQRGQINVWNSKYDQPKTR